jgi:hypothetical protein
LKPAGLELYILLFARSVVAMGIKQLSKLIAEHAPAAIKEITMDALTGRKLAIDACVP